MYKMLIVEDERWEREGLTDFLDWNSLGIELAGVACDGIEGLEKARELLPDIVITDIKMPGMDGLKMSHAIRDFLPDAKIVILTGYDDFKLAKEAIDISANAYILKPVEEEELLEALNRVLEECDRDRKKLDDGKKLEELLQENKAAIGRELLSGLLKGKAQAGVLQEIGQLGILPSCGRYAVIAAGLSPDGVPSGSPPEDNTESRAEEAFQLQGLEEGIELPLYFCPQDEVLYAIVWAEDLTALDLNKAAGALVDTVSRRGFKAAAGIGAITANMEELHVSCRQSRDALNVALFWGGRKTVSHDELDSNHQEQVQKVGEFLVQGNYYTKQLMHALRSADRERLEELLEEMFRFIEDNKWAEKSMIVNLLYGLLNETSLLFYNTNLSELDEGTAGALLLSLPDYRSVRGYARSFFEKAISIIQDKKGNKEEYVVRKVEQIVMERFNSDISIKTIAAEIYLSPNYLGSIFKKSMGVPFNDYLCQYRMEKAKELLKSPKNKVSKVAAEVGIPNSSYFCQLFKEMFGIAPGEYQDRILRGNI